MVTVDSSVKVPYGAVLFDITSDITNVRVRVLGRVADCGVGPQMTYSVHLHTDSVVTLHQLYTDPDEAVKVGVELVEVAESLAKSSLVKVG